jgi:hypothetical protein
MSTTTVALIAIVAVVVWLLERRGLFAEKAVDPDLLVLEQLRNAGSDLAKPHSPEFFLYFPQEGPARGASQALEAEGYSVRVEQSPGADGPWLASPPSQSSPPTRECSRSGSVSVQWRRVLAGLTMGGAPRS